MLLEKGNIIKFFNFKNDRIVRQKPRFRSISYPSAPLKGGSYMAVKTVPGLFDIDMVFTTELSGMSANDSITLYTKGGNETVIIVKATKLWDEINSSGKTVGFFRTETTFKGSGTKVDIVALDYSKKIIYTSHGRSSELASHIGDLTKAKDIGENEITDLNSLRKCV